MKVIDSTIFCAAYEKDLLYLKMLLEDPVVSEFVITECQFDYRGRFKGPIVAKMINDDRRFDKFRDKITVCSIDTNLSNSDHRLENVIDPPQYAQAEFVLRDACTQYLLAKYEPDDVVFSSDVDECIDFTDEERRGRMLSYLSKGLPWQFDRVRYHWDFDVRAFREVGDCITPAYCIKHLRSGFARLQDKKWVGEPVACGKRPAVFEYCFCFSSYEDILAKFNSSLHTQWDKKLIDDSIAANHWPQTLYQGAPNPGNRWHWFERVHLTPDNSPQYVRDNLEVLRTNLVPLDYQKNRFLLYGYSPHFPENDEA